MYYAARQSIVRPPVRSIIHPLKLVGYLFIQADKLCSIPHVESTLLIKSLYNLIRAVSDCKAFLYILIGGFAKAANQNIEKRFYSQRRLGLCITVQGHCDTTDDLKLQ